MPEQDGVDPARLDVVDEPPILGADFARPGALIVVDIQIRDRPRSTVGLLAAVLDLAVYA